MLSCLLTLLPHDYPVIISHITIICRLWVAAKEVEVEEGSELPEVKIFSIGGRAGDHEMSMAIMIMAMVVLTAAMTVTVIGNQFVVVRVFISTNVMLLSISCLLKMTNHLSMI